jgi:hypothetical protein
MPCYYFLRKYFVKRNSIKPSGDEPDNDIFTNAMIYRVQLKDGDVVDRCNLYVDGTWAGMLIDNVAYVGVLLHSVLVGDEWTVLLNDIDTMWFQRDQKRFVLRRSDSYTARLQRIHSRCRF